MLLPATVLVGVAATFRVAGPVWRFETYLGAIARGEEPAGPCRIRAGDELQELCGAINGALEATRNAARAEALAAASEPGEPSRAA